MCDGVIYNKRNTGVGRSRFIVVTMQNRVNSCNHHNLHASFHMNNCKPTFTPLFPPHTVHWGVPLLLAQSSQNLWDFISDKSNEDGMPYDPEIPLLGIYSKKPEILTRKNIHSLMFIAELFTIAKIWKQPKYPSVDEWIKKLWYIYRTEYHLAIKKKEILPFATA